MNFSIKKEFIIENILNVSKALSNKNLIPILSGIKFELSSEGLLLTASDNDIAIETFIQKENFEQITEYGSIVINGHYIVEIIKKLPNEIINFNVVDGTKVMISTKTSEFNLNGMIASEFPNLNVEKRKNPIILNSKIFKKIINETSFASSTQESRPILTGINFKIENNILNIVATDSYRLAKKIIQLDSKLENINIVIPSKNLNELVKIILNDDIDILIHIFNNKVLFEFENILFQSRLLSGTYPDINPLIPTDYEITITTNLNELIRVIDRVSLLSSEKDKNIVNFETKDNQIIITSSSPEIGHATENILFERNSQSNINIAFSSKYMLDALKTFDNDQISLNFNGSEKPIIIKDLTNDNLIQLVLPIRIY